MPLAPEPWLTTWAGRVRAICSGPSLSVGTIGAGVPATPNTRRIRVDALRAAEGRLSTLSAQYEVVDDERLRTHSMPLGVMRSRLIIRGRTPARGKQAGSYLAVSIAMARSRLGVGGPRPDL